MFQPCVIGTWPFSKEPAQVALHSLVEGCPAVEAIESGINVAEDDPAYGPYHVGRAGWRNSAGLLQLDAAIMDGRQLQFGAVTALSGFPRAISVAKRVLSHSKHSMLTGEGAATFAAAQGFKPEHGLGSTKNTSSKTDGKTEPGHDTLGLLCVDQTGNISAGVSTSGAANKEPGRVGDSALPGSGLYADSELGAACCSGDGDQILKHCPSYRVVGLIKEGLSPQEACTKVVSDILRRSKTQTGFEMVIIAIDKESRVGAANAGVHTWTDDVTDVEHPGFPYVVARAGEGGAVLKYTPPVGI